MRSLMYKAPPCEKYRIKAKSKHTASRNITNPEFLVEKLAIQGTPAGQFSDLLTQSLLILVRCYPTSSTSPTTRAHLYYSIKKRFIPETGPWVFAIEFNNGPIRGSSRRRSISILSGARQSFEIKTFNIPCKHFPQTCVEPHSPQTVDHGDKHLP